MSYVLSILLLVVLIAVNGVFVAAEFALVGSRESRLRTMADDGNRAAAWVLSVIRAVNGKDSYIAVAQLGITLASIGLGMYGEPSVASWLVGPFHDLGLSAGAAHTVAFIVGLSIITFLHVVIGEMIPKSLALQAPEQVIVKVNPIIRGFWTLFRPIVSVLNLIAVGLLHLFRFRDPDPESLLHTGAELAFVTDESAASGELGVMQRNLIHNVFELDERPADEIMTPRDRIETVDVGATPAELTALATGSPRSRYLVVDGDLDRVLGLLHVKDFIRAEQRGRGLAVRSLMRPIPTVDGATTGEQILEIFRRNRTHACLVADGDGRTIGLVTMDDVIEHVMDGDTTGPTPA